MSSDETLPVETAEGQIAALTEDRDRLAAEKAELQDRLLRARAEFDNFRRRAERERSEYLQFAGADLVKDLLPILDDFERALKVETADRNYVNRNFGGWQLGDARRELVRRMVADRELYDAAMRNLQVLYMKGLLEVDTSPEVHMEGASNLFGLDLHLTRERMCELLRALEEKKRLIELLDRFLEQPAGELEVHVGLEEAHPAMKDLALIGMTVQMASGLPAKVAVLGSMRMRYDRVMAAVFQTCRALESAQF